MRLTFEHLVYRAIFGCLLWTTTLLFQVGRPTPRLQLEGSDHGQTKPMGWKTEVFYGTVAQLIAEKIIGDRSPWECLHTAWQNFISLLSVVIKSFMRIVCAGYSIWVYYVRNPWYRFRGIEIPVPKPKICFTYRHLKENHIRLLLIRRSLYFKVSYHVIHVLLSDVPRYEAISYVWGDTTDTEEIEIDDKTFQTSCTVANVLRRMSKILGLPPGGERMLWIDFICINQEDVEEKNKQVPLMREIYTKSHATRVYLGDGFEANKANWLLIKLQALALTLTTEELAKRCMLEKDSPSWLSLTKMLSHKWFNRVWVIQEVAVAPRVFVLYGGGLLYWDLMSWALKTFSRWDMVTLLSRSDATTRRDLPSGLNSGMLISDIRISIMNKQPPTLGEALTMFTQFRSTDPRDKIFALLGLVSDNINLRSWVDYNKKTELVYRDTAKYLLTQDTEPLHILHFAGVGHPWSLSDLPSWVPDWSNPPKSSSLDHSPRYPHRYDASGGRKHDPQLLFGATDNELHLQGITVDEVGIIVKYQNIFLNGTTDEDLDNFPRDIVAWWKEIDALVAENCEETYLTGQPRQEAFWRILLGDRLFEGRPAPTIFGEYYQAMRGAISNPPPPESISFDSWADLRLKASRFLNNAYATIDGRRFCVTRNGYMGWVPLLTQVGDLICVFAGLRTPFIVRPHTGVEGIYLLVGECFFHGMMDGEMWNKDQEAEVFTIC